MSKRVIISVIGLIITLGMVSIAGEEDSRRIEEEKNAMIREIEQIQVRIEHLRLEAMEHELRAKQLQTEAARLEIQMRAETKKFKAHYEVAETERKVHQMFKEAEQLERRGHIDEAHRLRAHAEEIAGKIHAQMRQEQQRDLERMERNIGKLREASERAEKDGQIDRAKRLWDESEHLAEELERRIEGREREELMGMMHARMRELGEAIEKAEREGYERKADELREEANDLEREIHERERAMEAEHLEQEIHQLLAAAEEAEEQDKGDKADAMRHEAEQLERRLHELFEEDSDDEEDEDEDEEDEDDEDEDDDEDEVSIKEVPKTVRATILKHARGGAIEEIERENEDGTYIYEVEIIMGNKEIELKVAQNGELLGKEVEDEDDNDEDEDDDDEDDDDEDDEECEYEDDEDDLDELWEKIESLHRQLAELNEVVEHLRNELR